MSNRNVYNSPLERQVPRSPILSHGSSGIINQSSSPNLRDDFSVPGTPIILSLRSFNPNLQILASPINIGANLLGTSSSGTGSEQLVPKTPQERKYIELKVKNSPKSQSKWLEVLLSSKQESCSNNEEVNLTSEDVGIVPDSNVKKSEKLIDDESKDSEVTLIPQPDLLSLFNDCKSIWD